MKDDKMIPSFSPLEIMQQGGNRVEVIPVIPQGQKRDCQLPGFERLRATGGYGEMCFFHFSGEGFDIWYSNYRITEPSTFIARGSLPALELHIPFNAKFISWWDGQKENLLGDKQFELSFYPFIDTRSKFAEGSTCSTFDIHYAPAYLQKFSRHSPLLSAFLEKVQRGEQADLVRRPQFLSPEMSALVMGMLQYDMPPALAAYYYESKVQLMLIEVLNRLNALHAVPAIKYSAYDIERTLAAKEMIVADMSTRYSIPSLARATGFNEWKLQHTFKHLFGVTIFDYSQSARLDHAKHLLSVTKDPIHVIAGQCGYPDHSNLSAAFKKKFGCTPDHFRGQKK